MQRLVLSLAALSLAFAACGAEGQDPTTSTSPSSSLSVTSSSFSSTTSSPSPSTVVTSTTAPTTTVTTSTPGTAVAAAPSPFNLDPSWAEPGPNSGGANGSGCSPGAGPLPDGVWFGFATAVAGDSMTFDLACLWFGEAAWDEAAKDGEEAPNDVYIRNENPALRTVAIDGETPTHRVDWTGSLELVVTTYAEWPGFHGTGGSCPDSCPIWLIVDQGVVTDVVEQYLP